MNTYEYHSFNQSLIPFLAVVKLACCEQIEQTDPSLVSLVPLVPQLVWSSQVDVDCHSNFKVESA